MRDFFNSDFKSTQRAYYAEYDMHVSIWSRTSVSDHVSWFLIMNVSFWSCTLVSDHESQFLIIYVSFWMLLISFLCYSSVSDVTQQLLMLLVSFWCYSSASDDDKMDKQQNEKKCGNNLTEFRQRMSSGDQVLLWIVSYVLLSCSWFDFVQIQPGNPMFVSSHIMG